MQVTALPAPVDPESCSYSIQGVSREGSATFQAGQQVAVVVACRDQYGNAAVLDVLDLKATANGPAGAMDFLPQKVPSFL